MDRKKPIDEINRVQGVRICPKCSSLSLTYADGKLKCSRCGYETQVSTKG